MIKSILKLYISRAYRIKLRRYFNYLRGFYYSGNNFYCICCDKSYKKFLVFGNIKRDNAKCPGCSSLERTRLLQYYLQNETDIFSKDRHILHFAPEYMLSKRLRQSSKNYISVDIQKGLADRIEDIQHLTFADNKFNHLICSCVLGHVPDEAKAIDEIYRVLKAGGKAYVLTVIDLNNNQTFEDGNILSEADRLNFYGEKDLLRLHGRDFIIRLKRSCGTVKEVDYSLDFSLNERERFSLGNKERELIYEIEKLF